MLKLEGMVDIIVDLDNGIYSFIDRSATGKTRLAKLLKQYAAVGNPVMSYSYNDKIIGVDFDTIVKPGIQKLLVLDRYDLYNGEFREQIEEFAKTGIVLIDIKGDTELDCKFCYIESEESAIKVMGCAND